MFNDKFIVHLSLCEKNPLSFEFGVHELLLCMKTVDKPEVGIRLRASGFLYPLICRK